MKKQKTRRELEDEVKYYKYVSVFFLVCVFVSIVIVTFGAYGITKSFYETQLSECQEQVNVWTLKVYCESDTDNRDLYGQVFGDKMVVTIKGEYHTYQEYIKAKDKWEQEENCEVLE